MLKKISGLLSVLSFALVLPASAEMKVRCDSTDGHYHECAAGVANSVTVARQWSKTDCVRGQNWGYRDGMIWVDEGCRADFNVVPSYNGMTSSSRSDDVNYNRRGRTNARMVTQTVICESDDGHRRHCSADTSGGVRITKRLSKSNCVYNHDWGYDNNGVWVANGCRAEFNVRSNASVAAQGLANNVVLCESENGRRKTCPADTRFGVAVFHQLSDSDCVMNRTWGYDSNGIWVTSGCRAEFTLNPR
jgi:hypothetical protein